MTTTTTNIEQQELPAGWKWVKLQEIASNDKHAIADGPFGSSLKVKDYVDSGVPVLQGQNITGNRFNLHGIRFITEDKSDELSRSWVRTGDILMVKIGSIGYSAIVDDLQGYSHAVIPANLAKITLNEELVCRDYLAFWLTSDELINYLLGIATQTAQPALSLKTIRPMPVPLPPLGEQKRIAGILQEQLAAVEEAKKAAQERLEAVKALPAAYLREVFPSSEDELPEGWKWVKLGDVCEIARGGSPRPISGYLTNSENGVNWVKIADATRSNKYIFETEEKIIEAGVRYSRLVQSGDFLLSNSMSFGRPYIMRTSGCIHDGWLVLSSYESSFNQDFLYYLLGSSSIYSEFKKLSAGSTVKNLNIQIVSRVSVPLLPLEEQKRISSELDDKIAGVKLAEASIQQELDTIEAMPAALLRKAFSGGL